MALFSKPVFTKDFEGKRILCVEFSPFEWSQQLVAIGTENKLIIARVSLDNESLQNDNIQFEEIKEFYHSSPVTAITWSSSTNVSSVPRVCKLATAGNDKIIRVFESNLDRSENVQELVGHLDHINALSFWTAQTENGEEKEILFSVSDDCSCKVWSVADGKLLKNIPLSSPGVAVKFNPADNSKFLIVEKSGLIRILNCSRYSPITSADPTDCGFVPCLDGDWSQTDGRRFVTLLGNRLLSWNLSKLSSPVEIDTVVGDVAQKVKLHPSLDNYYAVLGSPGPTVQVFHSGGQVLTSEPLLVASDLSWHHRAPLLAVANDTKLKLWKILVK